jgi:hypothetical protein
MSISNALASVAVRDLQSSVAVVMIKDPDRNSIAFTAALNSTTARGARA